MMKIRLNVFRLLNNDTVARIKCSCAQRSQCEIQIIVKVETGGTSIHETACLREICLFYLPEFKIPKLSILHGFQMLPGKAPISFNTLGRAKPA
jgi:hypothetical protein